jgi:ribosomal protein S6--L-glutamate ligase
MNRQKTSAGTGRISLGKRLRRSSIPCVGISPNFCDYLPEVAAEIESASRVCYPGPVYEEIFLSAGKDIFPRNYYAFLGNKIAQTNFFQLLGIPHPKTRIYYGRNRIDRIEADFRYPFMAKVPVGSSQGLGVFLVHSREDLNGYLERQNPAYIQQYLPIDRDLRTVVIGGNVVHAYWRIHCESDFRNNVSRGGSISFEDVPVTAIDFAAEVVSRCRFDEVGLDICLYEGKYWVLEANMVYGLEGFKKKGMDIHEIIAELFDSGKII